MKRISMENRIRRRAWRVCFLIGLFGGLFSGVQIRGEWSDAVKDAAARVAAGNPTPADLQIIFEHNQSINRMGARGTQNGGVNNQTYQANQKAFTAQNNEFIMKAANECGLQVEIKPPRVDPKTGEPDPLAGTDTDGNVKTKDGKPLTYDQWKKLNDAYKRNVNEFLKKPANSPVNTGTDLMPDPNTTSPQDFDKICGEVKNQGGTTYRDPAAVRVEGAMADGKPIVINEVGNYVKELQGQAKAHFDAAAQTTAEANAAAKIYGENSPQVQDLRAKAQIENSQGAKYIEKIENVGDRISQQSGSTSPQGEQAPSSKLTETLKNNRGADTMAQSEQIGPLSQNALNNATQKTIRDLARIGQANPEAAAGCQQAIADSLRDLPMSQKGQAMEMIKSKYGSDFAKGVAKAAQGPTGGAAVMKGFEKVMKVLGPGLLVYDGYKRITGALNAPDDAKTYVAGTAAGGFIGGLGGALGVGTLAGVAVAGILGAPVTVGVAGITIGAGIIGGALGYGVGDYAGTSLAGWVLEGVRPKSQAEYDALAAKGLLDGSKDIYGQLIAAGADPTTAAAAAAAYKNGDVKTFRDILAAVRNVLVKNKPKKPTRLFNALSTNEVAQLLDCLCSQSLGASPWVAQGYRPEPSDASPSCKNPSGGPCMAAGFGCWRSFIRWGNPGISDCLASFNLPTNQGWTRGQIDAAYQKPYEKPFKMNVNIEPLEFCPGDPVTVSIACEGGRGDYDYRYEVGWPLQRPKNGPKDGWTRTKSSSVTFATPELRRGVFNGQWIGERPHEAYPTYVQVWARSSAFDPVSGQDVPIEICRSLGVRMRSEDECTKLHPPPPPETKKPAVKPPAKSVPTVSKPSAVTSPDTTKPLAPGERVSVASGSTVPPPTGSKPTKSGTASKPPPPPSSAGSQGAQGPAGTGAGSGEGAAPGGTPKGGAGEGGGEGAAPGDECSFGGGATAIDNGPLNMWVEVPSNQRVRVTITGSDGFKQTLEGAGRVDIVRPRNPNGTDTITMENLDKPACRDQQVAQYDTNGIPTGMPTSTNAPGLAGSEAGIGDLPPDGTILIDTADALGGFVDNKSTKGSEKADKGFKTVKVNTDSQAKETSSDLDIAAADHVIDVAGADAQDAKNSTAIETAKSDQDNSWGKTLGDSIQKGFEDGAAAAATAFGTAAADQAAGAIFGGTKSGSDEEEEGSSGEGEQVAGGSTSSGGSSGSSGGASGGTGQGGTPPTVSQPSPPPTSSGSATGITMTCQFCGYTETLPPGVQPDPNSNCPKCGCGADKGLVTCEMCGYRWLVDAATGPTGPCPKCGGKGPVTPDSTGGGTAVGQAVGAGINSPASAGAGSVVGSGVGVGVPPQPAPLTPVR